MQQRYAHVQTKCHPKVQIGIQRVLIIQCPMVLSEIRLSFDEVVPIFTFVPKSPSHAQNLWKGTGFPQFLIDLKVLTSASTAVLL